ncbi:MAG TPA: hypothetical protein VNU70_05540, partial [Puia sp.]|nr:hypothetical protein [Puia sp.]
MSLHSFYQDKVVACQKEIRRLQDWLNGMAVLRVVLFAAFAWTIYLLIGEFSGALLFGTFLLAASFIFCVNSYLRWKEKRRLQERLRFLSENELAQLGGAANGFPDGAAWLDNTNYLDDLDIFGPGSLFHSLNRTTTAMGEATLAALLRQPLIDPDAIKDQQQAIRALTPQADSRQLLTATGLVSRELAQHEAGTGKQEVPDKGSLDRWLNTPPRMTNHGWLAIIISALTLFNLYGLYSLFDNGNYALVVGLILVSRMVTGIFSPYVNGQHRLIGHQQALLDQYAGILAVFNRIDTTGSPVLQQLRGQTARAHTAIRRLSRLTSFFDQRLNLLVNLVLNTFFFYDIFCMMALERWKAANRSEFPGWIDAVGTVECLNS